MTLCRFLEVSESTETPETKIEFHEYIYIYIYNLNREFYSFYNLG